MSYLDNFQVRIQLVQTRVLNHAESAPERLAAGDTSFISQMFYQIFDLDMRGLDGVSGAFLRWREEVKDVNSPSMKKLPKMAKILASMGGSKEEKLNNMVCALIVAAYKDAFEKAQVMTMGYLECLELLTNKEADWVSVLRTIGFYFGLSLCDQLEDFLKYQTASLVALSLSNNTDTQPDVVRCGHWRVGDFIPHCRDITTYIRKICIQRKSDLGVQLAFSLYTTKKIAPALSDSFVKKAMDKNLSALTELRPDVPDREDLEFQVRRTVRELFYRATHPNETHDTARTAADQRNKEIRLKGVRSCGSKRRCIPSLSACYENTRRDGGCLSYLLNHMGADHFDISDFYSQILIGYATRSDRFSDPVPIYGVFDEEDLEDLMYPSYKPRLDFVGKNTKTSPSQYYENLSFQDFGHGIGSSVLVRREPIREPFKVRIISKGEAVPYQRAHNYQPFLWSLLQLTECFALTGRPIQTNDVDQVLRFAKKSGVFCQIVSGDYAAATDNLHPLLCAAALDEICNLWKIPLQDAIVLKQCLIGHIIDCSKDSDYKFSKDFVNGPDIDHDLRQEYAVNQKQEINFDLRERFKDQQWGQLMGSFVSFPILCIINFAVTRFAMEGAFERYIGMWEKPCLVNGDDVLFCIPDGSYQDWVKIVTDAGLSPSVGKNFVSRRYAVINSRLFDCGAWHCPSVEANCKAVPLIKMNLLRCGQETTSSSTERTKGASAFIGDALMRGGTLETRMWELIEGFDDVMREKLLKRAYKYAKPLLMTLPPVSWVLPKCLGGLGLPATKDHEISLHHRKIASMIACTNGDARRDILRLTWLRQPEKVFCSKTNEQINDIYNKLDIPLVMSTSKNPEPLYPKLIKTNLGFGVDDTIMEPEKVLHEWRVMYSSWLKMIDKISWSDAPTVRAEKIRIETVKHVSYSDDIPLVFEDVVVEYKNPKQPQVGLHPMSERKCKNYQAFTWTREFPVSLT